MGYYPSFDPDYVPGSQVLNRADASPAQSTSQWATPVRLRELLRRDCSGKALGLHRPQRHYCFELFDVDQELRHRYIESLRNVTQALVEKAAPALLNVGQDVA